MIPAKTAGRTPPERRALIRWGIVGLGQMATRFASSLAASTGGCVDAAASRDLRRAEAFAREHRCRAHASYSDLCHDSTIDAVYVASVHSAHRPLVEEAARAGKAVLVEKPMAVDEAAVRSMLAAAEEARVPLLEGYMYRFHPRTELLRDLLRDGAIGEVLAVSASFCFRAGASPARRLVDPALGGGAILDVGGYPVSFARLVASASADREGEAQEPVHVAGTGTIGATGVDERASARLTFPTGMVATVRCGIQSTAVSEATVFGSHGHIVMADPWQPDVRTPALLHLSRLGRGSTAFELAPVDQYAAEADALHWAMLRGDHEAPEMTWADSLGNVRVLDAWRAAVLDDVRMRSDSWSRRERREWGRGFGVGIHPEGVLPYGPR